MSASDWPHKTHLSAATVSQVDSNPCTDQDNICFSFCSCTAVSAVVIQA
uniref:Uncharacterized protein n=1 Tax=Anguilla anguilla TaxID=7936 RepID=A0A0E9UQL4_ANGAN